MGFEAASFSADRSRMSRHVASYLRDLIMSGQFTPGSPLRLAELSALLEVSATPIREALVLLDAEGLVESKFHRGFVVNALSPRDVRDVFELHAFVAGTLAERAVATLTDTEIDELADLDGSIRRAASEGQGSEVEQLNYQFHRVINRSSDSAIAAHLLAQIAHFVPRRFYPEIEGWLEASATQHEPIVSALRCRDTPLARQLMERHLRASGDLLVAHLLAKGFWAGTGDRERETDRVAETST